MANEIEKRNEAFLIYQDENGIARVNVRFEGEDVWLNVEQMMELFDTSQQDLSYHIKQIYAEGEQDPERTHKKFLLVRQEGNRSVKRQMSHYNLGMIIAVGLSALVPADPVSVDLLGSVFYTVYVEKGVEARSSCC